MHASTARAILDLVSRAESAGSVEAPETVKVRPRVSGFIMAVKFAEGQMVEKDKTVLFEIDPVIYLADLKQAEAQVEVSKAQLELATRQAASSHALVDGTDIAGNASVLQAKAAFRDAWINAERNAIVAPTGGYVAQRSVQLGSRVQPGQALLTVIPLHDVWVDANFKESQLAHIRIGQPATIESDLYGGDVEYHGKVVGLGAGSGSAFALLPPQNASGNWIKVVQRVPVRVAIDAEQLKQHPLRIGLSTTVKVDTHDRNGAVLASAPATTPVGQTTVYDRDFAKAEAEADAIVTANLAAAR